LYHWFVIATCDTSYVSQCLRKRTYRTKFDDGRQIEADFFKTFFGWFVCLFFFSVSLSYFLCLMFLSLASESVNREEKFCEVFCVAALQQLPVFLLQITLVSRAVFHN
jgi:cellulose synthase/poly-beta-1,6-N-acetylglucosamine synthase-like glycosyltransferase